MARTKFVADNINNTLEFINGLTISNSSTIAGQENTVIKTAGTTIPGKIRIMDGMVQSGSNHEFPDNYNNYICINSATAKIDIVNQTGGIRIGNVFDESSGGGGIILNANHTSGMKLYAQYGGGVEAQVGSSSGFVVKDNNLGCGGFDIQLDSGAPIYLRSGSNSATGGVVDIKSSSVVNIYSNINTANTGSININNNSIAGGNIVISNLAPWGAGGSGGMYINTNGGNLYLENKAGGTWGFGICDKYEATDTLSWWSNTWGQQIINSSALTIVSPSFVVDGTDFGQAYNTNVSFVELDALTVTTSATLGSGNIVLQNNNTTAGEVKLANSHFLHTSGLASGIYMEESSIYNKMAILSGNSGLVIDASGSAGMTFYSKSNGGTEFHIDSSSGFNIRDNATSTGGFGVNLTGGGGSISLVQGGSSASAIWAQTSGGLINIKAGDLWDVGYPIGSRLININAIDGIELKNYTYGKTTTSTGKITIQNDATVNGGIDIIGINSNKISISDTGNIQLFNNTTNGQIQILAVGTDGTAELTVSGGSFKLYGGTNSYGQIGSTYINHSGGYHRAADVLSHILSPHTITIAQNLVYGDTTTSDVTFNLPPATDTIRDAHYTFKNVGTNSLIIHPDGTNAIDGKLGDKILAPMESITITCWGLGPSYPASYVWYTLNEGVVNNVPFTLTESGSPHTLTCQYIILCNGGAAAVTLNLPAVANETGRMYRIKNISATYNAIIEPSGAETIDGNPNFTLLPLEAVDVICDGVTWWIL